MFFKILVLFLNLSAVFANQEVIQAEFNKTYRKLINKDMVYVFEYTNITTFKPTRVTVSSTQATNAKPLLIVAEQNTRIQSWQIPYIVDASRNGSWYATIGHTLCSAWDRKLSTRDMMSSGPQLNHSNVTFIVKTSSAKNISFYLHVSIQDNFFIKSQKEYSTELSVSEPIYYYYNFHDKENRHDKTKAVLVTVKSNDDKCMMISIQNSSCPVFDLENNIRFKSFWQTMTKQSGMVVRKYNYPHGFYIVLVVKEDNLECNQPSETMPLIAKDELNTNTKIIQFTVVPTITLRDHLVIAGTTLAIFMGIFLVCVIVGIVQLTRGVKQNEMISLDSLDAGNTMLSDNDSPRWRQLFRKSPESKRSSNYVWHVGIVALFYTLPVVQLVLTYQQIFNDSGNEDLCYYNFLCAHPLGFITDFNHVFSNVGYIFLGLLFVIITYGQELVERSKQNKEFGLPKPYGMFYALGFALIMEGIMSACYHVCPKSTNFQFDTSFMYVMTVLMIVNIYENRQSTEDRRGYAVFGMLAITTLLSVIGIYVGTEYYFWIIFSVIQITFCFGITWAVEKVLIKSLFNKEREEKLTKVHICRVILWIFGNLINIALAAYGIYQRSGFGTYLLMVLIVNALFYTIYYITMKICYGEKILWVTWVFATMATVVWAAALYFFISSVTSWEMSPAESRNLNQECALVKYYDNHDIWHFLSAVALFFTFIVLLTLDEGIAEVPRTDIVDFHGF